VGKEYDVRDNVPAGSEQRAFSRTKKAAELALRLQVPLCDSPRAVSDALARYVVKMSAGHAAANNLKTDLLSKRCVSAVAERYGLREDTVRSIRDILSNVRSTVR
jgi:hypothetical protein